MVHDMIYDDIYQGSLVAAGSEGGVLSQSE